jgi:hypothetical protein
MGTHARNHSLDMGDGRIRQNTMPEIEDEWSAPKGSKDPIHAIVEGIAAGEQYRGIEVPLDGNCLLQFPRHRERNRPVETDSIDTGLTNIVTKMHTRAAGEANYFRTGN